MSQPIHHHRVLLVEDSPTDVYLMEASVELSGLPLALEVVGDGAEALQRLEQQHQNGNLPELVLLDLNMPRVNGFEVLEALGQRPDYGKLPVVVLTTSAAAPDRERSLALGANALVTKPIHFEEVVSLLERVTTALAGQLDWPQLA